MTESKTMSNEAYASFPETAKALASLNLHKDGLQVGSAWLDEKYENFMLYYKREGELVTTEGRVYQCGLGYYCVAIDDTIWCAPVVWNGPRAAWDESTNESMLRDFVAHVLEALHY